MKLSRTSSVAKLQWNENHRHSTVQPCYWRYIIAMGGSVTFCFFQQDPWGSDPSIDRHSKWLKRRGFGQGCAFCSKNWKLLYHLTHSPRKPEKLVERAQ